MVTFLQRVSFAFSFARQHYQQGGFQYEDFQCDSLEVFGPALTASLRSWRIPCPPRILRIAIHQRCHSSPLRTLSFGHIVRSI